MINTFKLLKSFKISPSIHKKYQCCSLTIDTEQEFKYSYHYQILYYISNILRYDVEKLAIVN